MMKDIPDYAFHNLITALISQSVRDYHKALKNGDKDKVTRRELELFFNGELFALATNGYPPKLFMKQIERGESHLTHKFDYRSAAMKSSYKKRKLEGGRCFG